MIFNALLWHKLFIGKNHPEIAIRFIDNVPMNTARYPIDHNLNLIRTGLSHKLCKIITAYIYDVERINEMIKRNTPVHHSGYDNMEPFFNIAFKD